MATRIREMVTVTKAAYELGVSRQTIHTRMKEYDLYVEDIGEAVGRRAALCLVDLTELLTLFGVGPGGKGEL